MLDEDHGELSFDETLSRLVSLLGRRVDVWVLDDASGTPAANCSGVLRRGDEIGSSGELIDDQEHFYFPLNEETGFSLDRASFRGAEGDAEGSVTISMGSLRLIVEPR